MLHCVFQIEHHSIFRTGNPMYYINLPPYINCGKNEIIPVYHLFRRSPWIGAKQQFIMTMTGYYNFRLISISSTFPNYQNIHIKFFAARRCRSSYSFAREPFGNYILSCRLPDLSTYLQTNLKHANCLSLHSAWILKFSCRPTLVQSTEFPNW